MPTALGTGGKPMIFSLATAELTPEERSAAGEHRREQMEQVGTRLKEQADSEGWTDRPENQPSSASIRPWGNCYIARVIPNKEIRSKSGIIIPNATFAQDKPRAATVISVSEDLQEASSSGFRTPGYAKLKEADIRIRRGMPSGLTVFYDWNTGKEWTDASGDTLVLIDAGLPMGVYGDFDYAPRAENA